MRLRNLVGVHLSFLLEGLELAVVGGRIGSIALVLAPLLALHKARHHNFAPTFFIKMQLPLMLKFLLIKIGLGLDRSLNDAVDLAFEELAFFILRQSAFVA